MKRRFATLFILLLLTVSSSVLAQEGFVQYEEVIKLNIELPPEMADMADKMPNSQVASKHLYFKGDEALYKQSPEGEDGNVDIASDDGNFQFHFRQAESLTYYNFAEEQQIRKEDFMGRKFLVTSEIGSLPWRLTGEQSEFLGYMCQKAVATKDSTEYEAWFTPQINIPAGPGVDGLPGLILVLNVDGDQRSYVAKEVSLAPLADGTIKRPKKGKKVTSQEYATIVEEKMKEMGLDGEGSGGNTMVFQIRQ